MKLTVTTFLAAALAASGTQGQKSHAITGEFDYYGCVEIDCTNLQAVPVTPDGILIPENCETACTGHDFAVVFYDTCRCGDGVPAVTVVKDTQCDNPCQNDWANGACGHYNGDGTPYFGNLYTKCGIAQMPSVIIGSVAAQTGTQAQPTPAEAPGTQAPAYSVGTVDTCTEIAGQQTAYGGAGGAPAYLNTNTVVVATGVEGPTTVVTTVVVTVSSTPTEAATVSVATDTVLAYTVPAPSAPTGAVLPSVATVVASAYVNSPAASYGAPVSYGPAVPYGPALSYGPAGSYGPVGPEGPVGPAGPVEVTSSTVIASISQSTLYPIPESTPQALPATPYVVSGGGYTPDSATVSIATEYQPWFSTQAQSAIATPAYGITESSAAPTATPYDDGPTDPSSPTPDDTGASVTVPATGTGTGTAVGGAQPTPIATKPQGSGALAVALANNVVMAAVALFGMIAV